MHYPDWPRQEGIRHNKAWPVARVLDYGLTRIAPASWTYGHQLAAYWRCYGNVQAGAWIQRGNERWAIPAGRLFAIPPWHDHACGCDGPVDHAFVHVEVSTVTRAFCQEHWPRPLEIAVPGWSAARLRRVLSGLLTEQVDELPIRCQIEAFAAAFAAAVFALVPAAPRRRRGLLSDLPESLQLACTYIDAHLEDDLPVARLAAMMRVSEGHCSRMFKRHLGTSPTRYILDRRIVRALWLLTNTDDPIDAVAERSGFHQRSYFSRTFKRLTGRSPSEHRKRRP